MSKVAVTPRLAQGQTKDTVQAQLNEVSKALANGGNYKQVSCLLAEVEGEMFDKSMPRVREVEYEGKTYRASLGRGADEDNDTFSLWIVEAKNTIPAGKNGDISWAEIPAGSRRLRLFPVE